MLLNKGRAFTVDVKDVTAKGDLAGYGSVFGNVDEGYDVVESGAFSESLDTRGMPKMLWAHDMWEVPIGSWKKAEEDDQGLYVEGKINLDDAFAARVHTALKAGSVDGLSIGYRTKDYDIDERGIRRLKKVDLFEVSVVTFPMNELARVDAVKQLVEEGITKKQFERILRDAGFTRGQAKAIVADGFHGIAPRDAADDESETIAEIVQIGKSLFR